ncbi:4-oxalocrotonate tautomerase family protein [Undibacterium sp.]|uniref:tautomerase family protein n=1 Tax=Undibacterium sp. TaxID=1914977 RepID=UPI00374CF3EF
MPYLQLQTIKGLLSPEQKQYLMQKFSELLLEVEGGGNPEFRKWIMIKIEEQEPANWSVGELRPTAESIAQFVRLREAGRHS